MANKYANLVGTNKIKDEYTKINTGFDGVEVDINKLKTDVTAVNTRVDTIITTPISGEAATQEIVDARVSAVKSKTFASLDARFEETEQDIATHMAEKASQIVAATRDVSLTGIQTITTAVNRKIQSIIALGSIHNSKKMVQGIYANGGGARCVYTAGDTGNYLKANALLRFSDVLNTDVTVGDIQNVTNNGFDINWTKVGNGATGTAEIQFLVFYHG